ncbi:MAG: hypothetical protein ACYTGW_11465 [Planctomycetota bacterium]
MLVGLLLVATLVSVIIACGGGGGGSGTRRTSGPDMAPFLVAATFVGSGAMPQSGDKLLLLMSEDVVLVPSTLLTNADVVLSSGSLGNVVQGPTLVNPRTVEVTVGSGVALTPGTTTITLSNACDAIEDNTGNLAQAASAVVISAGDGDNPAISSFTLNGVNALLNGTGPAGGTLQVPDNGFSIDLVHADPTTPVDPSRTIVVADIGVEVAGTTRQAGTSLTDGLVHTGDATTSSLLVPASVVFPQGSVTLTAYVVDGSGMISAPQTFDLLIRFPDDVVRPFETTVNPSQVWYLDLSRDIESFIVDIADPIVPVFVNTGANGRPDVQDLFLALGLLSPTPIQNVQGALNSNDVVMNTFVALLLQEVDDLYAGTNVIFTDQPQEVFPEGAAWLPYNSFSSSQICIAGSESESGATGTLGVALFDPNNLYQDNNCLTDHNGFQRLGVFLHTIINEGFRSPPGSTFRTTYDPFTSVRGGVPIGEVADDGLRITGLLSDSRSIEIDVAIQRIARFTAVITAHECGHSVGLVANGPMPHGLYGNDPVNFPVFPDSAADGHIRMPASLFPGGAENVMSPSFNFDATLSPQTRFNSLNLAYLREQVLNNN